MAFEEMAARVVSGTVKTARKRTSRPVKTDDAILKPITEYACQIEVSMDATFEGNVSKQQLLRKMKSELVAAIKESATRVAREFDLESKGVRVQPLKFECAVNDQAGPDELL